VKLHNHQQVLKTDIYDSWQRHRNTLAVLPTGGGKTVIFSDILREFQRPSIAIAHRKELVGQMAMALAKQGVAHRIIGPKDVVDLIVSSQLEELGTHFYNPNAKCAVAGVDTLIARKRDLESWTKQVGLWVIDECHHVIKDNKWGKATALFPTAYGLGVTATPTRADGWGLGRHAHGVFDNMVEGPPMRWLIENDFLCDYRVFAPPSDLDLRTVPIGTGGEFSPKPLHSAVKSSSIVGDVVLHYQRIAPGKQGITFVDNIDTAIDVTQQFRLAGVRVEMLTGKTPADVRNEIIRRYRRKEIQQLVNVDLLGEGFDVPGIEVVSFARPTHSYGLYCQQFGRALRYLPGKTAIIIDHVGNIERFRGPPDKERDWSLDAREKMPRMKHDEDDVPTRICTECTMPYERIKSACPRCGHVPVPASRTSIEFVDGDLYELDADTLASMRNDVAKVRDPESMIKWMTASGKSGVVINSYRKNAERRIEMLDALTESISWWAIYQRNAGRSDSESYRLFYHMFGVDQLTAQSLGRPEALALADRINAKLGEMA
jgi:DNA repair protein RadD